MSECQICDLDNCLLKTIDSKAVSRRVPKGLDFFDQELGRVRPTSGVFSKKSGKPLSIGIRDIARDFSEELGKTSNRLVELDSEYLVNREKQRIFHNPQDDCACHGEMCGDLPYKRQVRLAINSLYVTSLKVIRAQARER